MEKLKETCPFEHCNWKFACEPEPHNFTNSFKEARIKFSSVFLSNLESHIVSSEETRTFVAESIWS